MSLAAELHQRSPSRAFACPVELVVKVVVAGTVEAAVEATDARWPSVSQALARASAGQASPYSRVHFISYIAGLIPMLAIHPARWRAAKTVSKVSRLTTLGRRITYNMIIWCAGNASWPSSLCSAIEAVTPTASQPDSWHRSRAGPKKAGSELPEKVRAFNRATRAIDAHTMSTAGAPSRPQSSAVQLSGLRTLATTWSKLPSRLSLHARTLCGLS